MASSAASSSQGVTLKKTGGSAIAYINSIDGLEYKAGTLDTTALDSVSGYKTFVAGFREISDLAVSGFYSSLDHDVFMTDFNTGTKINYTIQFPNVGASTGAKWTFDGIVIGFKTKSAVDSVITFDATIKVVGAPNQFAATP